VIARLGRWACRLLAFVILFWGVGTVVQLAAAPVIAQQAEAKPCQDPFINPSCTGKTLDPRTGSPSLGDCKTTPSPQAPGDGLSGSIDSGDPHPDPKAAKDNIYERYGFLPPWHTYDLGCTSAIDPDSWWAAVDTNIGNWLKGFATSLVALANALHRFVDPPTFMHHFDPMIVSATDAMHRAIYEPWIAVSVLLIGAGLMMSSHKGNLPRTVTAAAWAVFVMGVATALWEYPLWVGRTVDSGETWVSNQIDQSILGKSSTDSTQARAELLVDNVLYKQWMLGEVGSASPVQHVHDQALALLGDQAYTYEEAAKIAQHGDAANKINEGKAKDFKAKASDLQKHYPNAYSHLKGEAGGRIGAGGESFVAALCVVPFMIMADLLKILSFFIIRWLVVLSPAIAVFAIFWRWKSVFWAVANRAGTAVLNALMFGVGAALATLSTGIMFSGTVGLPMWASMLMCLIVNIILWQMFKPLRHLAAQVSPASVLTRQGTHHRRGYWGHRYRRYRRHYRRMNRAVGRLDGALVGANGGGGRHARPDDDEDDESYVPETEAPIETSSLPHEAWTPPPAEPRTWTLPTTPPDGGDTPLPEAPELSPVAGGESAHTDATPTYADVPEEGEAPAPPTPHHLAPVASADEPEDEPEDEPHVEPNPAPEPPRADSVIIEDGTHAWRIWDPESRQYHDIAKPPEEELGA
jgi:hypothetical protein